MKNERKEIFFLLLTLHKVMKKYDKLYCYPSQLTIIALLGMCHTVNIAIATINRWLRIAEDKRYITRTRRTKKDKKLGTMFQSTLYKITLQGYHVLAACGNDVWKEMAAARAAALKDAERGLAKLKGLQPIKTILAAPMIFGVKERTWLVEK